MRRIQSPENGFSRRAGRPALEALRLLVNSKPVWFGYMQWHKGTFQQHSEERRRKKGTVFLKSLGVAETGTLVDEGILACRCIGVLVKLLTNGISDKASRRNKLDVDPPVRSGTGHLRIGLGIILGIRQLRGL